jgi:hypothetical protein
MEGSTLVRTVIAYDGAGRAVKTWNPERTTSPARCAQPTGAFKCLWNRRNRRSGLGHTRKSSKCACPRTGCHWLFEPETRAIDDCDLRLQSAS